MLHLERGQAMGLAQTWTVTFSTKAERAAERLKKEKPKARERLLTLVREIESSGPIRKNWPSFKPLKGEGEGVYHCHFRTGHPVYVACWRVLNKKSKEIEVYYVGSHEHAPY